jgi:hypothetical protein
MLLAQVGAMPATSFETDAPPVWFASAGLLDQSVRPPIMGVGTGANFATPTARSSAGDALGRHETG